MELRTRFCEGLAATRSMTPWVLQEVSAAIDLLLQSPRQKTLHTSLAASATHALPGIRRQMGVRYVPPVQKLVEQIRAVIRSKHYSRRTEEAYIYWARQFIRFNGKRHPTEMAEVEVSQFLERLAVNKAVALFLRLNVS
jgi:hypothetical protein